jgi:hypothetical protein
LRRALTPRIALTGDYDIQQATIIDGGRFQVQNSSAGMEYQISEAMRAFGGFGLSRLNAAEDRAARIGPAVRLGLVRLTPSAEVSVLFNRSFVPSYGFGGTTDNEEFTTRVRVPIARRLSATGSFSFRRNEPVDVLRGFRLRSLWFYGGLGYLLNDWVRVEAYSSGARQNQPDGRMNRYHVGVQVTAATTARIR